MRPVNHQPRPLTIVFPTRSLTGPKPAKVCRWYNTDVAKTWEKFRRLDRLKAMKEGE